MNIRKILATLSCFALLFTLIPTAALAADATAELSLAGNNPSDETVDPGEDDVVFLRIDIEADGDIEVEDITFTAFGDFETSDLNNLQLINGDTDQVLETESRLTGTTVTFNSFNLDIEDGDTVQLELRADIDDEAINGSSIGFRLSERDDVDISDEDNDPANIEGVFPIRGERMDIGFNGDLSVRLGANNPGDRLVEKGSKDVTLATFEFSAGEDVRVNSLTFTAFGDFNEDDFDDFRLIDLEDDDEIGDLDSLNDDNKLVFNDDFEFREDEDFEVALIGDIDSDTPNGSYIGFRISDADDIDAESDEDGDDLTAKGSFPLRSNETTIGSADSLDFDLSNGSPDESTFEPGDSNVTVFVFEVSAPEDLEVEKIRLRAYGDYEQEDLEDFRLIDTANGDVLGRANDWTGDDYVEFDDGFSMEAGDTFVIALQVDIVDDSTGGSDFTFQLESENDVEAVLDDNGDDAEITGSFPIRAEEMTIAIEDGLFFSVDKQSPEDQRVVPGEDDVVFLVFRMTSGLSSEIKGLKFTASGDFDEDDFDDFQLIDLEDDDRLGFERRIDGRILEFEDEFEVRGGNTRRIALVADVSPDAKLGNDISFELARKSHVDAEKLTGSQDADIYGEFPLEGEEVKIDTVSRRDDPGDDDEDEDTKDEDKNDIVFEGNSLEVEKRELPKANFEDSVLEDFAEFLNPFPDTDFEQLLGKAAAELNRREVIGGYPDGEFKGDRLVNRAEAAKMLLLAKYGEVNDKDNSGNFSDVFDGEWYVKYVITAEEQGIINGYPDGTFGPGNTVNTAEFLKMLSLTFGLGTSYEHAYTDFAAEEWFSGFAGSATHFELFPERTATELEPGRELTREEVAVALYQYLARK